MSQVKKILSVFDERKLSDDLLFGDLDKKDNKLKSVIVAWKEGDTDKARRLLARHFRGRKKPVWMYDARQKPTKVVRPIFFGNKIEDDSLAKNIMTNKFIREDLGLVVDMGPNMEDVTQRSLWSHGTESIVYNRHPFISALCSCYAGTREKKYSNKVIQFVTDWINQRPLVVVPDIGPHSYHLTFQPDQEAMSLGFQMMSWFEILYSGVADQISDELLLRVIKRMWFTMVQYRRFASDIYTPGNHHLFERGVLPIIYGTMFPEFVSMHNFLKTGPAVVKRHLIRAICKDGSSNEHSVTYGRGALNLYDMAIYFGSLNNFLVFTRTEKKKLNKAYLYTIQCVAPDGKTVPFGDGGRRVDASELLISALASGLPEAKGVCEALNVTPNFLLPLDRAKYKRISLRLPSLVGVFKGTGFVFARDSWDSKALMLAMSIPHPEVYLHGHQDLLSVLVYMHGKSFIGHPAFELYGTMSTAHWRHRIERSRFYNMTTQNCLLVHSHPVKPDEAFGSFGSPAPRCRVEKVSTMDDGFYIRAYHEGYRFARHTREVVLLNGKGVLVNDKLTPLECENTERQAYGPGGCPIARREIFHTQRWHLDYGVTAEKVDNASIVLQNGGKYILLAWLPEEIEALNIYPMWYLPMPPERQEKERPMVVDVLFGPSISTSVGMLITPLSNRDINRKVLGKMRKQFIQWRQKYCKRI